MSISLRVHFPFGFLRPGVSNWHSMTASLVLGL